MPSTSKPPILWHLLLVLFLTIGPTPSHSFFFYSTPQHLRTLRSLLVRVANLRASRGDISGSEHARFIAHKLDRFSGLGFYRSAVSLGWDYLRNYAWSGGTASFDMLGILSDLNELMTCLGEFNRSGGVGSQARNYRNALKVSKSLFQRLLKVFYRSGPLRELVHTLQKEVIDGDLLWDCLELGSNDLKGLIQIMKDTVLQYTSTSDRSDL